jgi:hypothetical protein
LLANLRVSAPLEKSPAPLVGELIPEALSHLSCGN